MTAPATRIGLSFFLSILFWSAEVIALYANRGVRCIHRQGYSQVAGCESNGGFADAPLVNPNSDSEYQEYDVIEASTLDNTIEDAVQRIIEDALRGTSNTDKKGELTPVEKFQNMYREMKSTKRERKDGSVGKLDSAVMLEELLGGTQTLDPFDERKVMMKLRSMLNQEDFKDLFLDDKIGDWL